MPALVLGFTALASIVTKIGPALSSIFAGGLTMGGFGAIAATVAAVAGAATLIIGATSEVKKSYGEISGAMKKAEAEYTSNIDSEKSLRDEYVALSSK